MVVVEGARDKVGNEVELIVTNALQTAAGKMIFGKVDEKGVDAAVGLAGGAAAGVVRGAENGGAHREMAEGEGQAS